MGFATSFWSETIWLPPNVTWADFDSRPESAQFNDLLIPFPLALLLICIRILLEKGVFRPIGVRLGIPHPVRRKVEKQPVLEEAWKNKGKQKWDPAALSKDTGLTERQVQRWYRRRGAAGRATPLDKFSETGWRWVFYFVAHVASVWVLWDKSWVWDTFYCWYEYPYHPLDPAVWWHYMLEMAFYWSLFITQFFDVKRKDFWEMFVHHVATLALLVLSWTNHMHRMGSVVLLVHDFADHWLELAKLFRYAGYNTACDATFALFTLVWAFSRLGLFPSWVCYSTIVEAAQIVQMFPVYYIFNFLMTLLLMLHVIWFTFLVNIVVQVIAADKDGIEDVRSDSESDEGGDSVSDSEAEIKKQK